MKTHQLIGLVAAEIIKHSLETREESDSTVARFLLDRLTQSQVAEICRQILADPILHSVVEIKIPRAFSNGEHLPEEILTDERTTYWRNASCDKPILVLANNDDDQGQSLRDLASLNAKELKSHIELWVALASRGLLLTDDLKKQWVKALTGLQQADEYTLEMFADYIVHVRTCIEQEHLPLVDALGYALQVLNIPRDTGYFHSIPDKNRMNVIKWQKLYKDALTKRACLLRKHLPNQQRIDDDDLRKQFDDVRDEINPEAHEIIERFILAPDDWTPESAQLAQFEWEKDGISGLFTGLRTRKIDLATETREFFENEDPDALTQEDHLYLDNLSKRRTREPADEDKEFYDRHHLALDKNRQLKAKWDKFVYGKPIECTDFLVGLLDCIERLTTQAGGTQKKHQFVVKTQYEKGRSKWINGLNHDVGMYFCTRYRGLDTLTHPYIDWQTFWLFEYDRLIDEQKSKDKSKGEKFSKNVSISREATQLKFHIKLIYSINGKTEFNTTQLIWKCNPTAIGMELCDDLNRLSEKPFLLTSVNREPVSKKGHLQEISLNDVNTLEAAFGQNRGSLVSVSTKAKDAFKILRAKFQEAYTDGRLSQEDTNALKQAWKNFTESYAQAIKSFAGEDGISNEYFVKQADAYHNLLQTLQNHASGDKNRVDLWHPILEIGTVRILGGKPAAIIAPWHPLRLLSIAVKARQFAHFVQYIIENPQVEFGDDRLFFFHLKNDIEHPYYPEVAVGFQEEQPKLLSLSDTVNDYSLMELPLRETVDQAPTTNENPHEASGKVRDVIQRYLELQPHKRSSMSLVLYNCDSKGLPMAVVDKLTSLYEDKASSEVCCQIILRHQDTQKLSELYEKMIGSEEANPDAFIPSESENDFMSRLRIGIMATDAETIGPSQEKTADIIFLQDVISRQAQLVWIPAPQDSRSPQPLEHFPARWSRRHPTAQGDMRSTVYLVCPSQLAVGTAYLNVIHDVVGEQPEKGKHFLPARRVLFQDGVTQRIFQEVHQLGEWVVNYDDLLEKRSLQHQGVTVIKYQQNRSQDRNLIISSTSSFQLLHVLVKQRLEKLNLGGDTNIDRLASKCIEEAKAISGDIVLRAARRGANASELIGLVLSKHLLCSELQTDEPVGWFFLDDYANWLGQDEQQIADIMALALSHRDGEPILRILITEAKYVETNVADARKTSQKQLKETVQRIQGALFQHNPSRLDRDIWLARLSDLLIDGILVSSRQAMDIHQWRENLRRGELQIEVKGYSHVFAPFADTGNISEDLQLKIPGVDACYQEVFGRKRVQDLILSLYHDKSSLPIRKSIGDDQPWLKHSSQLPVPGTLWKAQASENIETKQNGAIPTQKPVVHQYQDMSRSEGEALDEKKHSEATTDILKGLLSASPSVSLVTSTAQQTNTGQIASQTVKDEKNDQWSREILDTLQRALLSYSLQAKVLGSRLTPNALLIRLKGSDRLRVEDIEKKKSVLLTTHGLSILNILAQPGEIVLSIARPQRETVSLQEVWRQRDLFVAPGEMNLCFIVGIKEMDGEILYLNLGKSFDHLPNHAPHTLIAGTTGSGKSVLMQNLLLDICKTNSPQFAHIYLIDPKKGVDYQQLLGLPHLREGIITEQGRAQEILSFLVDQMEQRYELLSKSNVSNLIEYNRKVEPNERVPVLWLVHDEFADWMLVNEYKEAVSASVQRLGTKARAAGIHLIFAAQRPDANVLPPQLRDNLGNRLILRVESQGTSEIALGGEKGAEKLLGKGHLAAKLGGEIIYAQVPFLSPEEQIQVVEEIRRQNYVEK